MNEPGQRDDEESDDSEYRNDALSELMTGAYAATSMVSMSVPPPREGVPAPPDWSPSEDAPKAEILDHESGLPAQIESGRHRAIEEEIDIELEADPEESEIASGEIDVDYGEDEDEPAASISTESAVIVTPQHTKGALLTGGYPVVPVQVRSPDPEPGRSSKMPWVLGTLVLLVGAGVGGWIWTTNLASRGSGLGGEDAAVAATATPDPDPRPAPDPQPAEPPEPEPPAEQPQPEPSEEPAAPSTPDEAYAAAAARYQADRSNDALLEMALAACELGHGPDARAAFRKLVGGDVRSRAVVHCRDRGIDVTAEVEGYTAQELADQAKAALDEGDAEQALTLAKQSNQTARNQAALELIVLAHCSLEQRSAAKKMMRHVSKKRRRSVAKACADLGVRVR